MKVVVVGATGNVGTSVLQALSADERMAEIVGVARRVPNLTIPKVRWVAADIVKDDLTGPFAGSNAVVHLAWKIQPSHDREQLRATNVTGSRRVFEAAGALGVDAVVYASSVGAYSPGPKDERVDELWPTGGITTSSYSRDKAEVERLLDLFDVAYPTTRWVRMRPGLIFKRESGSEIRRIFLGPLMPVQFLRKPKIPIFPAIEGLVFQAVHATDVANAFVAAINSNVRGAFNLAADPVLDVAVMAEALGARTIPMAGAVARAAVAASWRARVQPTDPGWLDIALNVPLLDSNRAHQELNWQPKVKSTDALLALLEGMIAGAGVDSPPLHTPLPNRVLHRTRSVVQRLTKR